ncbi:MAG: hypothetical protein QHJ73_00715 [Armatimonadota bacterium]|nr:hypothetical protein [Armatimonadota bacterium]
MNDEETGWQRADTTWFRQAGWGVLCHYLAAPPSSRGQAGAMTPDAWNRLVDGFDTRGLAAQLGSAGVRYFFITLGQNTGFYCAPNQTYDSLVPHRPSRLSRRDLVSDLHDALAPYGIRLLVYLPSHAAAEDRTAVEALRCTPRWDASAWGLRPGAYLAAPGVDDRLSDFQRNWEAVIREWSLRWGTKVWGWWIDGCYHADRMYRHPNAPNFRTFAQAMKAGNPQSLVAFNPGVRVPVVSLTEYEDYTAGEVAGALPVRMDSQWNRQDKAARYWGMPISATVDGAQYHVLSFLGEYWCGGTAPRFPNELAIGYTRHINSIGGVVTWDVPIGQDGAQNGLIPEAFLRQLRAMGEALP